ncbi:MAG: hypothetical protein SPF17_01215 [Candidatus Mucispirillum faecigallinarum]|nr:hypothetical protein [Candidatus Mucispirillum faecigallinarum]
MMIDMNKIILYFVLSIYSGVLSILAGLNSPFVVIICFFIYSFMLKVLKDNKIVLEILLGVTILVPLIQFFAPPHIKDIVSKIFFASGYIFHIITLYYLIAYMKTAKKLFIDNKEYIYIDKFKYAFGPGIISVIVFGLFFYPLCIFEKHIGFMNTILIFGAFAVLTAAVAGFKIIPYIYAFKVISLKDKGQIFIQDIYNGHDNVKFFNRFIEPYINHVYLDDDKICFYSSEKERLQKKKNKIIIKIFSLNLLKELTI